MTKFDMIKAVKWLPDTKLIIAKKYVDTVFSTAVDYPYVTYGDKPRAIRMLHEGDWDGHGRWRLMPRWTVIRRGSLLSSPTRSSTNRRSDHGDMTRRNASSFFGRDPVLQINGRAYARLFLFMEERCTKMSQCNDASWRVPRSTWVR
jgi:hypothetical protein